MAAFVKYGLTTAGRNLIVKGSAGKAISYTRIAVGDGQLTQAQDPSTMTALVKEVISLDITSVEVIGDGQVRVRGTFNNSQLQTGFLYRELGLFATDPDTGLEVLYCYGNAVDRAEWIPPAGSSTAIERIINVVTTVGSATNVTAVIRSGAYVTITDFVEEKTRVDTELSNKVNKTAARNSIVKADASGNLVAAEEGKDFLKPKSTALVNAVYPVGSIYISVTNTNPSSLFGGTWAAFGTGRTLVGVDTTQNEFNTVQKTGGAKTHTLTLSQIPPHSHKTVEKRGYAFYGGERVYEPAGPASGTGYATDPNFLNTGSAGSGGAHNNLQPYITVYMWRRTA